MRLNSRGVSLTELMVAMVILTGAVVVGIQSFSVITRSLRASRAKTIATNLAQERMEVMKNLSYYQLIVTTDTAVETNYTPNLVYDNTNYTKETINLWGLPAFSRAVMVSYGAIINGTLTLASSDSMDTGLKVVTVYVWWNEDTTRKKVEVRSIYANPNAASIDSGFQGVMNISGGGVLSGGTVSIIGNPEWTATTTSDTPYNYTLPTTAGTYTLLFRAPGYYDKTLSAQACVRGSYASVASVDMVPMSLASVRGTVWMNPSLLISQVVASTPTAGGDPVEYVELYNPTTYTWTANDTSLQLWYREHDSGSAAAQIPLTYNTLSILPSSYYLIANRASILIAGVSVAADAQYTSLGDDVIEDDSDGGLGIKSSGGSFWDAIAWQEGSNPGHDPPSDLVKGVWLSTALNSDNQYVRYSSTGAYSASVGSAYDTRNNSVNFAFNSTLSVLPKNSSTKKVPVSGRPAHGAYVKVNDTFSASTVAVSYNMGTSQEYAQYSIIDVATGTWRVDISSNSSMYTSRSVSFAPSAAVVVPNASTNPAWPVSSYAVALLSYTVTGGFIEGYVYGADAAYSTPLANVLMEANGSSVRTSVAGYYRINVSAGAVTVNANHNSDDPAYVSKSENGTVTEGAVSSIPPAPYFHLGSSGRIKGYVTSGSAAYPNITVRATLGLQVLEGVSDQTGYFYINVPANGSDIYTVTPSLDNIQTYTSAQNGASLKPLTVTPVASATVFAGTITVTGGTGAVTGTVRENGDLITGGVLIVASDAALSTIGNPPPAVYGSSAPGQAFIYYSASTSADGTYRLDVRPTSALNMRAFYTTVDPNTGAISARSPQDRAGLTVTAGQTLSGQDFSW